MGRTIKNIAKVKEPEGISLASNPNYIQFESHTAAASLSKVVFSLEVAGNPSNITDPKSETAFEIIDKDNTSYTFCATRKETELNDRIFYLADNKEVLAENIRVSLLQNTYLKRNFDIVIPLTAEGKAGSVIRFYAKGTGNAYLFKFANKGTAGFYALPSGAPTYVGSNDSLSGDNRSCEIELDIYSDTGVFAGCDDHTATGSPLVSLSKAYAGKAIWFDINAATGNEANYSNAFLHADGWCNAGTARDVRVVAKRHDGKNHDVFYVSDVLYAVSGYTRNLEQPQLAGSDLQTGYVYDTERNRIVQPLTRQPLLTHTKGQKQFFNFILQDAHHKESFCTMSIGYRLKSQSGRVLDFVKKHSRRNNLLHMVNTICLDLDGAIGAYAGEGCVGEVEAYLYRDDDCVSEPLVFTILPECLHRVNDFAFLNSLGGWSSFNFGGTGQYEFKTKAKTVSTTQTPTQGISEAVERILEKEVEELFTVETAPLKREVMEWLKEISTSLAVYELASKRYVLVESLDVKYNTRDDLFTAQMKYRYSDSQRG